MMLPEPESYRPALLSNGANYPLKPVKSLPAGLLSELPAVEGKQGWPWTEQTPPSCYAGLQVWPKLTIVVPSFNQGEFIEETLRSILLQNYPCLELIIMDGKSSDGTLAVLKKYGRWISYYQSEKDEGQAQAINMGFALACGDYYAWINSDDYYLPGVFNLIIRKFLTANTDFIYGYAMDYNQQHGKYTLIKVPPVSDYFIKIPALMQPSCFWRAGIHQPLWEELHCALDYELWLRLLKGKKRIRLKEPLSVARSHAEAKTYALAMKEQWHRDHLKIWSDEGHGPVPEWKRITLLNRIRMKVYKYFKII